MIPYKPNRVFTTLDLKEALEYAEKTFKFDVATIPSSELSLNEKGEVYIQGKHFEISKSGISNLCTTLKIPDPFAEHIPTDLLITNINRLVQERGQNLLSVYSDQDDVIVDVNIRLKYLPIDSDYLLGLLELEKDDKVRFKFENHLMLTEVGLKKFEFMPDTHTQTLGFSIAHYPTLTHATTGQTMLWTMICSNGSFIGRSGEIVKLRVKSTQSMEKAITVFMEKIIPSLNVEDASQAFVNMQNTQVTVEDAKKYLNTLKSLEIESLDMLLFGPITKEEINEKYKVDPTEKLEMSFYELYYNLTNLGSNYLTGALDSQKVSKIAGKLLLDFLWN